jgi:hypothetical protein
MLRSFASLLLAVAVAALALAPRQSRGEVLPAFDATAALTIAMCEEAPQTSDALSPPVVEIPEGNAAWIYRTWDLEPQRHAQPRPRLWL